MKLKYLVSIIFINTFIFLFLLSCTRKENINYRLSQFENLLSKNELVLFNKLKKDNNKVKLVELLTQKYAKNSDFKTKLNKIKHTESINLFSIKQVIEYFYNNFR